MRERDFREWYEFHAMATGAPPGVAEMFARNEATFSERIRATAGELCDATNTIVASGAIPVFANEHLAAVLRELRRSREDAAAKARPDAAEDAYTDAPRCPCGGAGLVVVPHPRCLWDRRLVLDPRSGKVLTTAVLCDRPACDAGARVRSKESDRRPPPEPRLALSQYARRYGIDGPELLAAHERQAAEKARENSPGGPSGRLFASLLAKVRRPDAA